jgi:ankyrin repeat protein
MSNGEPENLLFETLRTGYDPDFLIRSPQIPQLISFMGNKNEDWEKRLIVSYALETDRLQSELNPEYAIAYKDALKPLDVQLLEAARAGDIPWIESLLARGVDIHTYGPSNITALHIAAHSGHCHVVEYLLAKGADSKLKQLSDWTPLQAAVTGNQKQVVMLLLTEDVDVDTKTVDGETLLDIAADYGSVDVAEYLLSNGADAKLKNEDGKTALDIAINKGRDSIIELLKAK